MCHPVQWQRHYWYVSPKRTYPNGIFELFGLRPELIEFIHLGHPCGLEASRRLRQGHPPAVGRSPDLAPPSPLRLQQTDALQPTDVLPPAAAAPRSLLAPPRPTTDPQASADRPTDGPTFSTCCRRPLGAFLSHSRCRFSCLGSFAQPPSPPSPPRRCRCRRRRRCWWRRRHSSHGALARGSRVPSDEGGTGSGGNGGGGRGGGVVS